MFDRSKDPPWYLLPLLPVVFAVGLVLILTVAILSIPYGFCPRTDAGISMTSMRLPTKRSCSRPACKIK